MLNNPLQVKTYDRCKLTLIFKFTHKIINNKILLIIIGHKLTDEVEKHYVTNINSENQKYVNHLKVNKLYIIEIF